MNQGQFKDRLKLAIGDKSINSFAQKCEMPESLLRKYLSGVTLPGLDKLVAITKTAGVSINWLATGEGPVRSNELQKDRVGVDEELLEAAIEISEELLETLGKRGTPKQKTQLIMALYDLANEREDHKIDRPTALRLVKLMAA
ncbi:MAG: bacteriophage CI repressor [Geobacter sp.]|nr:MAG: bacteriophage CI repressor [Geobacter sp.]